MVAVQFAGLSGPGFWENHVGEFRQRLTEAGNPRRSEVFSVDSALEAIRRILHQAEIFVALPYENV